MPGIPATADLLITVCLRPLPVGVSLREYLGPRVCLTFLATGEHAKTTGSCGAVDPIAVIGAGLIAGAWELPKDGSSPPTLMWADPAYE